MLKTFFCIALDSLRCVCYTWSGHGNTEGRDMTKTMTYERQTRHGKKRVTLKTQKPLHIDCIEDFIMRCINLNINIEPDALIDSVISKGVENE